MDAGFGSAILWGFGLIILLILAVIGVLAGCLMWVMGWPLFGGYHPSLLTLACTVIVATIMLWGRW
ncbi:MAG: hypothetical protein AB9900_11020 [Humidesulfovibrio sp.]